MKGHVAVALNLFNNEDIMNDFFDSLLGMFTLLGSERVSLSVYESGSSDGTDEELSHWREALGHLHIPARIRAM